MGRWLLYYENVHIAKGWNSFCAELSARIFLVTFLKMWVLGFLLLILGCRRKALKHWKHLTTQPLISLPTVHWTLVRSLCHPDTGSTWYRAPRGRFVVQAPMGAGCRTAQPPWSEGHSWGLLEASWLHALVPLSNVGGASVCTKFSFFHYCDGYEHGENIHTSNASKTCFSKETLLNNVVLLCLGLLIITVLCLRVIWITVQFLSKSEHFLVWVERCI